MLVPKAPIVDWKLRAAGSGDAAWAAWFGGDPTLFAMGRHALAHGLRLLARGRGVRRVWCPAYVIRDVTDAVAVAGLDVAFYDVDERLEPRLEPLDPRPGDALLVIHYFGIAQPVDRIRAWCDAARIPLVEDAAHLLPDPASPVRAGASGDIAVFSLRKLAPLPDGGLLVVNDASLARVLPPPAAAAGAGLGRLVARLSLMLGERLACAAGWNILPLKQRLMNRLVDHRVSTASSTAAGGPAFVPTRPSRLLPHLLRRIDWEAIVRARKRRYQQLAERLSTVRGARVMIPVLPPGSVPESLPTWTDRPADAVRALRRAGVEAGSWPPPYERPPIDDSDYPGSAAWLEKSVCLPLGAPLTAGALDRIANVLSRPPSCSACRAVSTPREGDRSPPL